MVHYSDVRRLKSPVTDNLFDRVFWLKQKQMKALHCQWPMDSSQRVTDSESHHGLVARYPITLSWCHAASRPCIPMRIPCFLAIRNSMMTSSNGNIFRVTGHLCGEFTGYRPVTRSFDVFFDLHLNKRLSKQWWGWWFETPSHPLWQWHPHDNDCYAMIMIYCLATMNPNEKRLTSIS